MKLNSKSLFVLTGLGALALVGCETTQFPSSYIPASGPNAVIANFDGGTPSAVNSNLAEANQPGNLLRSAGTIVMGTYASSVTTLIAPAFTIGPTGASNTLNAAHITGKFHDNADAAYPSLSLRVPLEAGNLFYDASLFTGVKFYLKVSGSDVAAKRTFSIPVAQTTVPGSGGTCNPSASLNACYNDFNVPYNSTNGAWVPVSESFSTFTRGAYGADIAPKTLSGDNLKQILMLQWAEGNNNASGDVNVDFWVDEVQFF